MRRRKPILASLPLIGCCATLLSDDRAPPPFLRYEDRSHPGASPVVAQGPRATSSEVVVAWFGPHGDAGTRDADVWWCAQRAVREANAAGARGGGMIRLAPCWSDNPWGSGVAQLFRTVYQEEVVAVIGSVDGAAAHLAEQVVAKAHRPLINPVSTDASVNLAGVSWTFSCAPDDAVIARCLAGAMMADPESQRDRIAALNATDHDSRALAQELLRAFEPHGVSPMLRFEFPFGANPIPAVLEEVRFAAPSALVLIAGPEDSARWLKALRSAGVKARVYGSHHLGRNRFAELIDEPIGDVRYPVLAELDRSDRRTVAFIEAHRNEFGREPDFAAALAYDAVSLLVAALGRAHRDGIDLCSALLAVSPYEGIGGRIEWDETGRNVGGSTVMVTGEGPVY